MRNWKTTFAGIAAILGVVAKLVNGGALDAQDIGTLAAGVGLLGAKDFNVSHTQN